MSASFASWLAQAPTDWFHAFATSRRDVLRPQAASVRAIAAATSSAAGVARGLEALDRASLDVFFTALVSSRTTSEVPLAEVAARLPRIAAEADWADGIPSDPTDEGFIAALHRLLELGLVWPADPQSCDPAHLRTIRVQSEAVNLLPTSAAGAPVVASWHQGAEHLLSAGAARVDPQLATNAWQAAIAHVIASARAVLDSLAATPASRLTSGGIGKRELSRVASHTQMNEDRAISLLEILRAAGLLGVDNDPFDPQWLPTRQAASWREADPATAFTTLLQAWLTLTIDTALVQAGRSEHERLHVLSQPRKPLYAGFPMSVPQVPFIRLELLRLLAASDSAQTVDTLAARLRQRHPLFGPTTANSVAALLHEAAFLGVATTPVHHRHAYAGTHLCRVLVTDLDAAMAPTLGVHAFAREGLHVPAELTQLVGAHAVPAATSVIVQSDLTAVAPGPVSARVDAALRAVAEVETRGQGTVYRITAPAITAAIESGTSAETLLHDLTEVSATEVPETVRAMITHTAGRIRRVRTLATRAVVFVDDPVDLDIIVADPTMLPAGLQRLAPTVAAAAVPQDRLADLLAAAGHQLTAGADARQRPRFGVSEAEAPVTTRREPLVADADLAEFIETVRRQASAGQAAATQPYEIQDVLREAIAAKTAVRLETVTGSGRTDQLEIVPSELAGGYVRGLPVGAANQAGPNQAGQGQAGHHQGSQNQAGQERAGQRQPKPVIHAISRIVSARPLPRQAP